MNNATGIRDSSVQAPHQECCTRVAGAGGVRESRCCSDPAERAGSCTAGGRRPRARLRRPPNGRSARGGGSQNTLNRNEMWYGHTGWNDRHAHMSAQPCPQDASSRTCTATSGGTRGRSPLAFFEFLGTRRRTGSAAQLHQHRPGQQFYIIFHM